MLEKWCEHEGIGKGLLVHHLQKLELEDKVIPRLFSKDLDTSGKRHEIFDINSIAVRNVKSVEARELEIKPGITMIYGPNDAGKSTFLEGVELAIKGARGELIPALMRAGATEMEVKLRATACEIDRLYRRKITTRGKNAGEEKYEHELMVSIDGLKDNKVEKAQGLLQSWAMVDLDFVVRSSMVRQGYLADVLDEEASKRQALFFRLLALDGAEDTRAAIAKVVKREAARADVNNNAVAPAEKELAELRAKLAKVPLEQIQSRLFELESMTSSGASRVDKEARLSLIKRAIDNIEKLSAHREKIRAKITELNKAPALFIEIADMASKHAQAEANQRNLTRTVVQLETKLDHVVKHGRAIKREGTCVACGVPCGDQTKAAALERLRKEHDEIDAALKMARGHLQEAEGALTHFINERIRMSATAAEKLSIQHQVAQLHAAEGMLSTIIDPFDMKSARQDAAQLEELAGKDAADPKIAEEIQDWRRHMAEAEATKIRIAALEKTIADAKKPSDCGYQMAVLEQLETAFSKRGMPLWIARDHVGRVNQIAGELAAGDRYRYELGDELEVVIIDGEKKIHPRAASGSSRQRGALVLLCALALYLQELSSIRVPFLWIDEVPFQDEANQSLLIDILRNIGKRVPKVIFGASQWDVFEGKFDHQIGVLAPKLITADAIADSAAGRAPIVKLHNQPPPASAPDKQLETFDQLEQRINTPPAPADLGLPELKTIAPAAAEDDPF